MRGGGGGGSMRGSVSSTSSSVVHAPTTHPPTPPTSMIAPNTATLRSATSPYRTPAPAPLINPPSVPANYNVGHPLAGAGSMGPMRESGYAQAVPPVQQQTSAYGSPLPPPMHDISQRPYISGWFAYLFTFVKVGGFSCAKCQPLLKLFVMLQHLGSDAARNK